jgi:broad specificity phosphatase PhoE
LINIYIARHGETTWNVEGRIQGRSDPELSPKGYVQSLALFEELKERPISAIYTSTLQRSILTAQPISKYLSLPIQRHPELDEIAFGILEGKLLYNFDEELKREWDRFKENRLTYHIPGAENYTDVANRVKPFMEKILQNHKGQEILVVGHKVVNRFVIGMLLEFPLEKVLNIEQTNDCLYLIQRNGEIKVSHSIDGEVREGLLFEGHEVVQPTKYLA